MSVALVTLIASCLLCADKAPKGDMAAGQFTRDFAPSEDWIKAQEIPFRADVCLNGKWDFQPIPLPRDFKRDTGQAPELPPPVPGSWDKTPIKVPSPWNVNDWGTGRDSGPGTGHPYWPGSVCYPSYPESWEHAEMGWLRRTFRVPKGWTDRRIVLHFEAVAGQCDIVVNGKKAGEHFDSFLPFDVDVTALVHADAENELLVGVRHHRLFDKTSPTYPHFRVTYPPGSELERIVGIWQDVYLLGLPAVRVETVFVQPLVDQDTLVSEVVLRNDSDQAREVSVGGDVYPWVNLAGVAVLSAPEPKWKLDDPVLSFSAQRVVVKPGERATLTFKQKVKGRLKLWSPDSPNLHAVVFSVANGAGVIDKHLTRFGWRQLKITGPDLLLNGKKIQLFGDLSHPFGPFMMSRRFAWAWYRMIKDFGGNAVRPHAQPYPRCYLDVADEMGIMVLDETALFGSSIQLNFEDPAAWQRFAEHYDGLVLRDRNHPSVFGWSFGNELFAIFEQNRIPKEAADDFYRRLAQLGLRPRLFDPTRDWISCDGDEDLHGTLPVWSEHLGHGLQPIPELPRPQMVGESGGTYYATPKQLSAFNGDRAYESYAGRNEALAIDLYQNVVKMARPRLTYYSASEMVWFGLEHLPLGYKDWTRLPTTNDGVFFRPFEEGKPGMQLERIPPYVTTLNPGFDPDLPLYRPLAMFEAMKAALAPDGPKPCRWDHVPELTEPAAPPPSPTIDKVAFAGERTGGLHQKLTAWGVPLVEGDESGATKFLVIDGERLAGAPEEIRRQMDAVHERGGTVLLIVHQRPADLDAINRLLPSELDFTDRQATALVCRGNDPRLTGLSADDLYFAESEADRHILKCGLAGSLVKHGQVLLEASDTDWSLFNRVPEVAKCGAVVLYEQTVKPAGAALVEIADGHGRTIVSAIDFRPDSEKHMHLARNLLTRLGINMNEPKVNWLLPIATVADKGVTWRYTLDAPGEKWTQPGFSDAGWQSGRSGFGTDVPNSKVRTPWTTSDIWLRRECTLPDGAGQDLKLLAHHDEDVEVFMNGTLIYRAKGFVTSYQCIPVTGEMRKAFRQGLNTVAVHCRQTAGGQYIDVGLVDGVVPDSVTSDAKGAEHNLFLDGPQGK